MNVKTADGKFVAVDVPASAKRFDELKVGDKVKVTYNNNVFVRLKPPGEAAVDSAGTASTMGKEAQPGGAAAMVRTMTATVAEIDKSASSMTFVGPNGWKYSRRIVDPKVLDQVKMATGRHHLGHRPDGRRNEVAPGDERAAAGERRP